MDTGNLKIGYPRYEAIGYQGGLVEVVEHSETDIRCYLNGEEVNIDIYNKAVEVEILRYFIFNK